MAGGVGSLFFAILVVALCATTLLSWGVAEASIIPIPGLPIDPPNCWSSILNIQDCDTEIFISALTGKFENIGPACCKVLTEMDAKCWPKMFPLNPLFLPLLKNGCDRITAAAPAHKTPQLHVILGSPIDHLSMFKVV